ncbi:cytosine deaminase [Spathaspora passalidarum NRRL Y-27907]|uniref:Cytosine deaminase n=1 Tax=Spathaspora passalidarum (strain NRRL Y-27907 / 11-Y1) TaxID=619300 RepID=G3ATX5_SPAPN|nr:cytosine deaminase [Spathaspora passalidarum NRRL Y-27907]EGW30351.1 cytosine deaminase [Spathaspora passalidarum NRRL Y-27907]
MTFDDKKGLQIALEEAKKGYEEGGIPIGAALISSDGTVLGRGHNLRIQKGSATLHGETSALENAGRLPGKVYKDCTMYTTLSPCHMCTGAVLLYGIKRVVMGENANFVGAEHVLKSEGVEIVNLDDAECKALMKKFIDERPEEWNEDIGE